MILTELKSVLEATGFPVAYSHFNSAPKPPYICYLVAYSSNFFADSKVYHKISNVQIELYTIKKDLVVESRLESVLDEHEIPYETTEIFIGSENLFQKIYEVRLM